VALFQHSGHHYQMHAMHLDAFVVQVSDPIALGISDAS
jgi:hypothetical protein